MRYDYPMMMAGSTTITAPRMDQPTGIPATTAFYPSYMSTPQPPPPSSSRPHPHRRSSSTSTSSHASRYHQQQQQQFQQQQQQQQQQLQQQLLFYPPPFVPYQQMPYHQQLPYQHQRMQNLLHGSQYIAPYGNSLYSNQFGNQSSTQFSTHYQTQGYRPHYLLPLAPPTSQQHSTSSSFSSAQQLSALQKQQLQSQAKAQVQAQTLSPPKSKSLSASSKTHMPLFSAFSLRGSSHNKMTTHSSASQQQQQQQQKKKTSTQPQSGTIGIKPPTRVPKADRNRGPVDPKELSQRLHTILTQRELEAAARSNSSANSLSSGAASMSPMSPLPPQNALEQLPSQVGGDRSGRRIRSRGSGNLRAVYASNGTMPPSMAAPGSSSGSIRRQPFSAPHLSALAPPPSLPELERRRHRTRSLSPQEMSMHLDSSIGSGIGRDGTTIAQRRASSNAIPYVPSQAAQQFARTTIAGGGTRKSIAMQKPRKPYHHNQNMTLESPPQTAKSPALSSSTTSAPAVQHAFEDSLPLSDSKRQGLKEAADADDKPSELEPNAEATVEEKAVAAEAETGADIEETTAAEDKKPVAAADLNRIVQEHSVDWTQSDETIAVQRKRGKKEKKELEKREKREKKEKANNAGEADAGKQTRPLWRLKARLSSFSKDKLLPSAPTVTVVPVAEDIEDREVKVADVAPVADEIPRAQHVEESAIEEVKMAPTAPEIAPESVVSTVEPAVEPAVEVRAPVAAQPASTSPSVLSFTALAKSSSSSFLSRFKH
ncbi:hypothetical protein SBRCBS47491_000370 [Sporothrix bragantina]|uniref:Uncharacterized protein n=1 Tax=Sporothrix bragantina TaxID=671064 RepID=A0ABP0APR5_9PEZI